jgi:hypothetical protein
MGTRTAGRMSVNGKLCDKLFHVPSIRNLKQMNDEAFSADSEMRSILTVWLGPMVSVPDTARNAYINTIKIILFFMEMDTALTESDKKGTRSGISFDLAVSEPLPGKSE